MAGITLDKEIATTEFADSSSGTLDLPFLGANQDVLDAFEHWRRSYPRRMNQREALLYILRAWLFAAGEIPASNQVSSDATEQSQL